MVFSSPVLPKLKSPDADPRLRMDTEQAAWFGSIYTLGAAAGGLGAMLLNDMIGRKLSIMMSAVPSTIGRLLSLGREEKAAKVLRWLRGSHYDTHIELSAIQRSISTQGRVTLSQLGTPVYYRPILISVVMRFLQQMTGITPILVYLESIFIQSKVSLPPSWDAALVGVVRLFSVVTAAFLMDKAGRKALLYTSSMLMFLSSLTLTIISHTTPCPPLPTPPTFSLGLGNSTHHDIADVLEASHQGSAGILPLISTMVFIFGYALGWGPITWLLMSEVLPLVARGVASGLCVTISWLTAFMLTHAFTHLVDSYGLYVPYLCFTVVCVICLLFNAVCIPETRSRSLEEIENYFRTGLYTSGGGGLGSGPESGDGKRKYVSYDSALERSPAMTTCTSCQQQVMTNVSYKAGTYAWLMCLLFICCGLVLCCCLIPFFLKNFKDAYHTCPRCNRVLHVDKKQCCK
ncbi:hypothetical protein F2P81_014787 [Scophthalmus maximus]|uniref:Major facilitator superfamily (MFS) profile domain-containing protein n=1 Tax=Scophthalmus maximus TaxID=52904 RepID=A0A6A4SH10_SCOMX|nr:hypothetical protein F2P81_014787 [Scophthalmus maximus]